MTKISPIIGHENAQAQLARLMRQHKLPHAILLSGPRGIGKATLADVLTRCLLTGEGDAKLDGDSLFGDDLPEEEAHLQYDNGHPAIARIEAGGHGNLKLVEPLCDDKKGKMSFTTINVEQIRDVVEFMHLSTSEEGWRIVIVDPADGMNRNAENALLKVLEEPPQQTLLILVTHQPDKLLPTTRSRCREIRLHPPTIEQVVEIIKEKGKSITPEQQKWLTQLAPASAGSWLRYIEFDADKIYNNIIKAVAEPKTSTIQKTVTALAKLDAEPWQIACDLLLCAFQRLVMMQHEQLYLLPEEQDIFAQLQQQAGSEHWLEIWQEAVYWLPQTISGNYDKKQVLQSLLFQAANLPKKVA